MKKDYYYSEDITFCTNRKCERKGCMRHWDNYRGYKPYISVSDFTGTVYCPKEKKENDR